MGRPNITETMKKEIFGKNPNKWFTSEEVNKTLDENFAIVAKNVPDILRKLTRSGYLKRQRRGNVYEYSKR